MRHVIFPTQADADAFVQDLQSQGVARPELGSARVGRSTTYTAGGADGSNPADPVTFGATSPEDVSGRRYDNNAARLDQAPTGTSAASTSSYDASDVSPEGTAEDAGAGAVKGTGAGVIVGAVAGAVAIATTGGLAAIPVLLGMTALGAGVGAGVGAVGGAAGVDETHGDYTMEDERYDRLDRAIDGGGRAVAVDDSVPDDVVRAALSRHGGEMI